MRFPGLDGIQVAMRFSPVGTLLPALLALPSFLGNAAPAQTRLASSAQLTPVIALPDAIANGVAVSTGGRHFLTIAKQKGQDVPRLAEWVNGQLQPYPDAAWNAWQPGGDASAAFVNANSVRFGPDGTLWVVDAGAPEMGQPEEMHGPKLVGIDIETNKVVKVLFFESAVKPESYVDDVRFNGDRAYLTDAGVPGIIVVHMPDGSMYRVLDHDPSTIAQKPLHAEGRELKNKQGQPIFFHADQLEVSPDGSTLYFQPCSGPLSSIPVQYIDDQKVTDAERTQHVKTFAKNGTAGGTAIDAAGNVYVSDTDRDSILRITPGGVVTTLVHDPRLVWADAMWITPDGRLWIPAAQLDRTPGMNNGQMAVKFPVTVYTFPIGRGPAANDHR